MTMAETETPSEKTLPSSNRLLFASCNSQHYEQVLWPSILSRDPSAFVWGGDTIYADDHVKVAMPDRIRTLYHQQRENPGYKELRDSIPILGVLDDHNYGVNNGDRTYPYKQESGTAFACEFLEQEGTAFCDRAKQGKGVYGVKVMDFGRPKGRELLSDLEAGLDPDVVEASPTHSLSDRSVAIFLLDTRTNQTPTKRGIEAAFADYEGDFLGQEQWTWFEEALRRSTAAVNIVVEGIQVHAERMGTADKVENWSNFPTARHRLYQAMLQSNVKAPMIVSGDVHHAQLLRRDCQYMHLQQGVPVSSTGERPAPRMLLEVTTSGMTHAWGDRNICARPHQLFLCRMTYFNWVIKHTMLLGQWLNGHSVWTEVLDLSTPDTAMHRTGEGKHGTQYALDLNFAEFEFDWEAASVTVQILGQQVGGPPLLSSKWSFESLSNGIQTMVGDQFFVESYDTLANHGAIRDTSSGQWVCANYRGRPNQVLKVVGFLVPVGTGLSATFLPFFAPFILLYLCYRRLVSGRKEKQS